jgi:glycosyltransferase 2 family protein
LLGKNRLKNISKVLFRIALSALALYVVFRKVDFNETKNIFLHANPFWLILAFAAFNLSKIISSFRLNIFFEPAGLVLDRLYNLRLYYVGMFYNLFLPGGIGGDGYKIYLLNKFYKTPVKLLISATLLDRISGMVSLSFLAFALALALNIPVGGAWPYIIPGSLVIITYPAFYLVFRMLFKKFIASFTGTNIYSLLVQGFQLVSAYCILKSLDMHDLYIEYLVLFLVSSVVAVLPFTIGGVGARDLVFILGSNYLLIDRNTAIAFSLMFFITTAISSFIGIFLETKIKDPCLPAGRNDQ